MLKTNNKKVKVYFDNFLSDILEACFDGQIELMQEQYVASCSDSRGRLYSVYCDKFQNYQEAFFEITLNYGDVYYQDMRNTLQEALEETDEEANKYSDDRVAYLYNYLLFNAYLRAIKKAGFDISKGFAR